MRHGSLDGRTLHLQANGETLSANYWREPESLLRVADLGAGSERFTVRVDPLRYLWVAPDESVIVGLGEGGTVEDPADGVVAFAPDGRVLLKAPLALVGAAHPLFNDRQWRPQVYVTEEQGRRTLVVEDRSSGLHLFELPR